MHSRILVQSLGAVALVATLGGCAGGGSVQPDRSVFSLDGNYQRYPFNLPIEEAFDRTVKVFKEAGYRLDVADRATGQISGERSKADEKAPSSDKGLKFYALIIPTTDGQSEVAIKIVQIIKQGSIMGGAKTEIIVNDAQMYQYTFRRIANLDFSNPAAQQPYSGVTRPVAPSRSRTELPPRQ